MILTKLVQHTNAMMAVAVKKIHIFYGPVFLIRQNINMATNGKMHCGLRSVVVRTCGLSGEMAAELTGLSVL